VRKGLEAGLGSGLGNPLGQETHSKVYVNIAEFGRHLRCKKTVVNIIFGRSASNSL